jgi:hypothetical protein
MAIQLYFRTHFFSSVFRDHLKHLPVFASAPIPASPIIISADLTLRFPFVFSSSLFLLLSSIFFRSSSLHRFRSSVLFFRLLREAFF